MATVTDSLITLLKMVGAPQYIGEMQKAAKSVDTLATAEKTHAEHGGRLKDLLGELGVEHALMAGKAAAAGLIIQESIKQFAENEDATFRATVQLRNLGNSYPIEQAAAFANELSNLTGISSSEILATEVLLKRFGAADKDIQSLTKTIVDFSAGMGIGLSEASVAAGHALTGNTRILNNMGVGFKTTGDQAKDLVQLQQKLASFTLGAAAAKVNTLSGSFDALKNALGNLLTTVGDKLSTVLVPVLHGVTSLITWISNNAPLATAAVGAAIGAFLGGPTGAIIGGLAGLGLGLLPSRKNPAESIGTGKSRLATEGTLQKVADNTAQLSPFIRQVIGGTGEVARRSFSFRDARMAFGV